MVIFTIFIHLKERRKKSKRGKKEFKKKKGRREEEKEKKNETPQPREYCCSRRNKHSPCTRTVLEAFPQESSRVKQLCPGSHHCPGRLQRGEEFKREWSVFLALPGVTSQHTWLALQNCLLQHNTCQKLLALRFLMEKDWLLCTAEIASVGTTDCPGQSAYLSALFYS